MTRDEAIKILPDMKGCGSELDTALDLAIEALKSSTTKVDDTISRQAAINAMKEHRNIFCDNTPKTFSVLPYGDKCRVDEIDITIATLINLPSTKSEVIRCKDCMYYTNGECDSAEMWQNLYGETTEVESINRYPNDFCSYAERRIDD